MRRFRGLTVVECLLALTILSVTTLAASYTLVAGQRHIQYGDRTATVVRLGKDLLEEIVSRPYRDTPAATTFGAEAGETSRALFDDVDDYHAYAEPAGTLADFAGTAYGEAEQPFSRSVSVAAGGVAVSDLGRSIAGVTVTVTVGAGNGEQWQFSRFIPDPVQP